MPLNTGELARRTENGIEMRAEPVRLIWAFDDLRSSDGHSLAARFSCSVQAMPNAAEQQLLAETFLSTRPALTMDHVTMHFEPAFRKAAADVTQTRAATELTAATGNSTVVEAMKSAGNRVAFSCGLALLAPFELEITSPTLEQARAKELQQALLKQQQEGQLKEFQRAADLVKQFNEIRKSAPGLSPGDILKQLNPADQGVILQTLLMASAKEKETAAVWAVAGTSLVRIDVRQMPLRGKAIAIPDSLGPLRSVQPAQGGPTLLVGARSGVIHVDPDRPMDAVCYADDAVTSQLGFSRALLWNNEVWACHGEAGIVAWKLGEPAKPAFALRPADLGGSSPRNLEGVSESQLVFSAGATLFALFGATAEGASPIVSPVGSDPPSEIVAILPELNRVLVVAKDGTVQWRDRKTLEVIRQEKPCGQVSAAALLPWLSSTRLLLAGEDGAVMCLGLDDDLVTQYQSAYHGMKSIAAAADVVAALSPDRQRVVIWRSWEARQPAGEVYVPTLAQHRAADVSV